MPSGSTHPEGNITMTQPATGTSFAAGGFGDLDPRLFERGGKIAALFRQARGADTDLSPHNEDGSIKYSPLAEDGRLRPDLLAFKKVAGGFYVPNGDDNQGWHLAGAFKEGDGPSTKPSIDDDDYMVEQTNEIYDSDRVKETEPFTITPVETLRGVVRRLRNGLPLTDEDGNNLVEYPGTPNTGYSKPTDHTPEEYQCLLVREFRKSGKTLVTVKGYDLVKNNDIGEAKMGKKDAEAAPLTFKPIPSGFFMAMVDGEYRPIIKHEWIDGSAWRAWRGSPTSQYLTTLGTQASGTFTLTFKGKTTDPLPYNATSAAVKAALVALDDGYTAADWTVTGSAGGPYTVTTPGGLPITGSGASLATPGTFAIAPVTS
jgi:hypothetical protein